MRVFPENISPSLKTNKPLFSTEAPTCYITVTIPEWREVFRRHLATERSRSQIFISQIYPDRQQKYRILEMIPPRVLLWWIKRFFLIRGQSFNEAKQNEMTKSFFLGKVIRVGISLRLPYNGRWEKNGKNF